MTWAGTFAAVALSGPALAAKGTSYFSATTTASAIHVSFAQSPADSIITGTLVNDAAGYAASGFDSGGSSEAAAAPLYPGTLVVGGPGLLCTDLFTCPFTPPAYPLLADASYPQTPTAHIGSTKPSVGIGSVLSLAPTSATAQAHADSNASTTRTGRISLLGGTPDAISAGSSTATTRVRSHGAQVSIDVTSSVSKIAIGPLLQIGSVQTTDAITLRHGRPPVDRPQVTISGVRFAGQRATITPSGIHLAGHQLAPIATKLARSGIKVHTLGIARADHVNSARSSAGGIEIDFAVPVKNVPYIPNPLGTLPGVGQIPGLDLKGTYIGVVQIGGAGAAGAVQHQADESFPAPASTTGRSGGKHPHTRPASAAGNGVTARAAPAPAAPIVAGANRSQGLGLVALSRDDLMTIYLVLALGTAGIFLGWRGSVAARRHPGLTGRRR